MDPTTEIDEHTRPENDRPARVRGGAGLILALLATTAFYAYFCAASERPWDRDSLVRSMYVQRAFMYRYLLVDPWARPLGIIAYLPVALLPLDVQHGFAAVKSLSCAYSVLACLFVALAARGMNVRHSWTALIALGAQPVFCQMSAGITPETIFVTIFALALWCRARGRVRAEVLCYALLPLARFENVVLFAPVAVYLLWQVRRPRLLLLLAAPTLLWYAAVAWLRHDLLWMATYGREMATWVPYALDRSMRWKTDALVDPLHYFYLAPQVFGLALLFLVAVRLVRRWDMLSLYLVFMVGVHCILKGRAGHAGYPRHILPIAPLLALFAAQGLECLETGSSRLHSLLVRCAAIAALCLTCVLSCRPLKLAQPGSEIRQQAARYLLDHAPHAPHLTSHPRIDFFLNRNWCDHPRLNWAALDAAADGTYVLWDETSARSDHQVKFEEINSDPRFREVARFPPRKDVRSLLLGLFGRPDGSPPKGYAVVVFRKMPDDTEDGR